jgi:TPR repeat protein
MQWVFETLGIDKQADVGAVRKAYAKAIKQCDQATEAERFQRIRQAYEFALQWAKQREEPSLSAESPPDPAATTPTANPQALDLRAPAASEPRNWMAPFDAQAQIMAPPRPPGDARAAAKAVLDEFLAEARNPYVVSIAGLLGKHANDPRLTSLDAKAEFEQALLAHIFSGPVFVVTLDAACDLFAWETSHRHLTARPDLVHRMLRHQALRHALQASKQSPYEDLQWAVRAYNAAKGRARSPIQPWEVVKANRVLERFEGYKHELGERYSAEAFDWWRHALNSNPSLLASYRENKVAAEAPPPRRSQRTTSNPRNGFFLVWPILAVLGGVVSHLPSSQPSYDPIAQTAPYQPPAAPAPRQQTDPFLMDIAALRRAAEQGDATAQNYLAVRYENGVGVAQDVRIAAMWFRRAADQGLPEAQFRLGQLCKTGNGVPQSARLALMWWQKAALGGHALAQDSLAEAYASGDGVAQDYQAARRWWEKAALNNIAGANTRLGWLYENGHGVPVDLHAALNWYRKAAAQGDINGQIQLALMYEHGKGVPADKVIADALLTVATAHQDQRAPNERGWKEHLRLLSASFTPAQRSAADQLARALASSPADFLSTLDAAAQSSRRT